MNYFWLFKIIFREYIEKEVEYKKNYQNTVKGKKKQFIFV